MSIAVLYFMRHPLENEFRYNEANGNNLSDGDGGFGVYIKS